MYDASGNPADTRPDYTPALLSAMLRATADNLDRTPIAIVVEEALMQSFLDGSGGAMALNRVTRTLRDTATIVDNMPELI